MSLNSSSKLASFAPYTPPPDDPSHASTSRASRTWFPSAATTETSYQSGGVPTFGTSEAGGAGALAAAEGQQNEWETRLPFRIDALAAFTYILGPVSAFLILAFETQNDYLRFHAYQSALLTGPLLIIRILMSLIGFWQWLRFLVTLVIWVAQFYMAYQAFIGASGVTLHRFHLPYIGFIAEDWVAEE